MDNKILKYMYSDSRLTGTHLRILLCLLEKRELNQAKMMELLQIKRQNINKATKELFSYGYIVVSRVEGRNKFYKLSNFKDIDVILRGQIGLLE